MHAQFGTPNGKMAREPNADIVEKPTKKVNTVPLASTAQKERTGDDADETIASSSKDNGVETNAPHDSVDAAKEVLVEAKAAALGESALIPVDASPAMTVPANKNVLYEIGFGIHLKAGNAHAYMKILYLSKAEAISKHLEMTKKMPEKMFGENVTSSVKDNSMLIEVPATKRPNKMLAALAHYAQMLNPETIVNDNSDGSQIEALVAERKVVAVQTEKKLNSENATNKVMIYIYDVGAVGLNSIPVVGFDKIRFWRPTKEQEVAGVQYFRRYVCLEDKDAEDIIRTYRNSGVHVSMRTTNEQGWGLLGAPPEMLH